MAVCLFPGGETMKVLLSGVPRTLAAALCALTIGGGIVAATAGDNDDNKPRITVRASPAGGFSPLRVVVTAELKGGANDFQDFYCASVEWHWDDGTKSESRADCDPYEAGKSEIKRRYTVDRVFPMAGEFNVEFRLKQKSKTVGSGKTLIRIRPGVRDPGGN